ncbi:MAG: hypothetical protein JO115_06330 [Pseudonocardiales bacterium]|nr:hypothetical protein [Pseudonocardiales bacterium]
MEWTAATIRRFRDVGLSLPREKFAKELGFTKRTIGNAERGACKPGLALRRALDQAFEKASDLQRNRFLAAQNKANEERKTPSATTSPGLPLAEVLGAALVGGEGHETVELARRIAVSDAGTSPGNDGTSLSHPLTELASLLLAHGAAASAATTDLTPEQEARVHQLADYLRTWAANVNRRELIRLLPVGTGGYPFAARTVPEATPGLDIDPVEHFQHMRKVLMHNDRVFGANSTILSVHEQINNLQQLRQNYRETDQQKLLYLQAQFADLCGWLYQDSGDYCPAIYWCGRALEWSHMCDDHDAIAFILARKSHLAADMGDPAEALDAAEAALDAAPHKVGRIAAVAMTFAGQAHALRGEKTDCERSYAMAHDLTERLETDPASPWALFLDPSYIEVYRARSLTFLGEYGAAVESFQRAISSLPRGYRRDRGVYLAREAGAHLGQGDVEQACAVGLQALAIGAETRSARIIGELKHLNASLGQFPSNSSAADFRDAMNTTFSPWRLTDHNG